MAVETGRALARQFDAAIDGGIELLLRERRQQKPQPLKLSRRQQTVEHLKVIGQRDQLALADVTQFGTWGQIHRRRKFSEKLVRQVEVDIKPLEIAPVLLLERINHKMREDKAALLMLWMRQRVKALWKQVLVADLVRGHRRKAVPGGAGRQLDPNPLLQRLAPVHRDALCRAVAQIVALV